jgi:hypothetical protein
VLASRPSGDPEALVIQTKQDSFMFEASSAVETVEDRRRPTSSRGLVLTVALAALAAACSPAGESGNEGEPRNQAQAEPAAVQATEAEVAAAEPVDEPPRPPIDPKLNAAFKAAFGSYDSAYVERKVKNKVEEITFTPDRIVQAPFGPVLLSEGLLANGGHPGTGKVAVHYLRPDGAGYAVAKEFVPAVETGSNGNIGEMTVRFDFGDYPMLLTNGGFTGTGSTCGWTVFTELRPEGPAELLMVANYSDDEGIRWGEDGRVKLGKPKVIQGKVARVRKGKSFDMVYSGSDSFADRYVRRGDRYEVVGGRPKLEPC